jgi:hypothetical protein
MHYAYRRVKRRLGEEDSTERRPNPQHLKVVSGDQSPLKHTAVEARLNVLYRRNLGERAVVLPKALIFVP